MIYLYVYSPKLHLFEVILNRNLQDNRVIKLQAVNTKETLTTHLLFHYSYSSLHYSIEFSMLYYKAGISVGMLKTAIKRTNK